MGYSDELLELLTMEIPTSQKCDDGFLDITKQGHKEIIISRIYAYFLNISDCENVSKLFITTLLEIINKKSTKQLTMDSFYADCEEHTELGNKIDLVIGNYTQGHLNEAILIENKIYHSVNNPLLDYWNSVKLDDNKKIGILLTLNNASIPDDVKGKFINVTHNEWMQGINAKGLPSDIPVRTFVYLTDFIRNMEQLQKAIIMNEQAKFFFKYSEKVQSAIDTKTEAKKYIIEQIRIAGEKMGNGWNYSNKGDTWGEIWDGHSHAYFVIGYEEMLKGNKKIKVILQLYKTARENYESIITNLNTDEYFNRLDKEKPSHPGWVNLVFKYYDLTVEDIDNLSEFVYAKIMEEFNPILNKVLNLIESK